MKQSLRRLRDCLQRSDASSTPLHFAANQRIQRIETRGRGRPRISKEEKLIAVTSKIPFCERFLLSGSA